MIAIGGLQKIGEPIAITDTKTNILAETPTAGRVAYATDTNEDLVGDGTDWQRPLGGIPNSQSITRDGNGVITEWVVDGTTYTRPI
jgi:hypothetical protein